MTASHWRFLLVLNVALATGEADQATVTVDAVGAVNNANKPLSLLQHQKRNTVEVVHTEHDEDIMVHPKHPWAKRVSTGGHSGHSGSPPGAAPEAEVAAPEAAKAAAPTHEQPKLQHPKDAKHGKGSSEMLDRFEEHLQNALPRAAAYARKLPLVGRLSLVGDLVNYHMDNQEPHTEVADEQAAAEQAAAQQAALQQAAAQQEPVTDVAAQEAAPQAAAANPSNATATQGVQPPGSVEVAKPGARIQDYFFYAQNPSWVSLLGVLFYIILIGMTATFHQPNVPPTLEEGIAYTVAQSKMADKRFHFGLFACLEDKTMCCTVMCCSCFRWAETSDMMGVMTFPMALAIFFGLVYLDQFSICASIMLVLVCTSMRQKMREKFEMEHSSFKSVTIDCCTYLWCGCCAMIQEARQVEEAYNTKNKAVCEHPTA